MRRGAQGVSTACVCLSNHIKLFIIIVMNTTTIVAAGSAALLSLSFARGGAVATAKHESDSSNA